MSKDQVYLTQSGVEKFQLELSKLKARRVEIVKIIAEAREQGDLSENAEYQTAKEEQESLDSRIEEINSMLRNYILIDSQAKDATAIIRLGSVVQLHNLTSGDKQTLTIVGTMEANPFESKISDDSPVGQILMGKIIGEEVNLPSAKGHQPYKIISIS
ncbi:MAG: transcription elongation factor GreA [Candidatus Saccharibacteria bacterium]|nr:transcription elongation factor GreA [Candidatus Saccharibacteria bacterium]MCY4010695.1 transcription elongation factor GreA [Candidatus Saccharibacteria bacterium]MCY4088888.1 transcription elongation factor GreA [Candidatus Saccharibacteria bacterium]